MVAALASRVSDGDRAGGGLVVWLLAPEGLFPYAGLVAIFALASVRPAGVSLPALAGLLGVTALNFLSARSEDAWFVMAFPVVAWALGEASVKSD